jgi:hypothetical protein
VLTFVLFCFGFGLGSSGFRLDLPFIQEKVVGFGCAQFVSSFFVTENFIHVLRRNSNTLKIPV